MKNNSYFLTFCLIPLSIQAENIQCIHENERETPYPQQEHTLYKPYCWFQKRQAIGFPAIQSIKKQRLLGCKYRAVPTQALVYVQSAQSIENGTWYWRVRSVSKEGKEFSGARHTVLP